MTKRDILVLQKRVRCFSCGTEFEGYTEAPDEGFGYAAQLFECSGCHAIFSHSQEDAFYRGALRDRIAGVQCPVCARLLADTLRKIEFTGICPTCGLRDYAGIDDAVEARIPSYQIYE
jgi:hypothetical protein